MKKELKISFYTKITRVLALALVLCMGLCFSGCKNEKGGNHNFDGITNMRFSMNKDAVVAYDNRDFASNGTYKSYSNEEEKYIRLEFADGMRKYTLDTENGLYKIALISQNKNFLADIEESCGAHDKVKDGVYIWYGKLGGVFATMKVKAEGTLWVTEITKD